MAELGEVVAEAAEGVASEALHVAAASRAFTGRDATMVLGGIIMGAATSWWITKRVLQTKLEKKYAEQAEEEIAEMREHFRDKLVAREKKPDLGGLAEKAEELGYATPVSPKPAQPSAKDLAIAVAEEREQAERDANWDYEIETQFNRQDDKVPFVIHNDERNETGFDMVTYTYYDADDVIVDSDGNLINAVNEIVGDHNLRRFGAGSGDPNVVYIRNVALGMEIELIRSPDDYTEEVHGLKHTDEPYRRRQRRSSDDDAT